jgi:hypothetical protein
MERTSNSNKKPAVPGLFTCIYKMNNIEVDKFKNHLHTLSATNYTGKTITECQYNYETTVSNPRRPESSSASGALNILCIWQGNEVQ